MLSVMILGDKGGKNTITIIGRKQDIPDMIKVLTSKPEVYIVKPKSDTAMDFIMQAADRLYEGGN